MMKKSEQNTQNLWSFHDMVAVVDGVRYRKRPHMRSATASVGSGSVRAVVNTIARPTGLGNVGGSVELLTVAIMKG